MELWAVHDDAGMRLVSKKPVLVDGIYVTDGEAVELFENPGLFRGQCRKVRGLRLEEDVAWGVTE